jgi:hypothetical protein
VPYHCGVRRVVVAAIGVLIGAVGVSASTHPRVSAAPPPCTHTWDGGGDGINWEDAQNWIPDSVPGNDGFVGDPAAVACSPSAAIEIRLSNDFGDHISLGVARIAGTVTLDDGGRLFLDSAPSTGRSRIGTLQLRGGTEFGGSGAIDITNAMRWETGPAFISTVTTRQLSQITTAAPARFGTIVIAPGATLDVTDDVAGDCALGGAANGFGIRDGIRLVNRGAMTIAPCVYFAADWGTQFTNEGDVVIAAATTNPPGPTLTLPGGLGYYEGFLKASLGWPTAPPQWRNAAGSTLTLAGDAGQSFTIAARYTPGGAVSVAPGARLDVLDSVTAATGVEVQLGRAASGGVGSNACLATGGGSTCRRSQSEQFKNSARSGAPNVTVDLEQRGVGIGSPYGTTGLPVAGEQLQYATTGGAPTGADPFVITLIGRPWNPAPATAFSVGSAGQQLATCTATVTSPCLSSRTSLANGDVRLVVKSTTVSTTLIPLGPRFYR